MLNNVSWEELSRKSQYLFPDVASIDPNRGDLVVTGGDLEPETLIYGYSKGYFPMHIEHENSRILGWFSPVNRGIFDLDNVKVSKSTKKSAKKFVCGINTNFGEVIDTCMSLPREGGWIDQEFNRAYKKLFDLGLAHSVETYEDGELVGGLYGVGFAGFFAGESMFSVSSNASKVALIHLVEHLRKNGAKLLDAQWITPHLESLGAFSVSRQEYLLRLEESLEINSINWP